MAPSPSKKIFNYFEKAYCISLPDREARRVRARSQFAKLGIPVELVDGVRCDDARGFARTGIRGAFLAHLKTLEQGARETEGPFLVFEDDLLAPRALHALDLAPELEKVDWSFFYLGYAFFHATTFTRLPGTRLLQPADDCLYQAHAYSINRKLLPAVIEELHAIHDREPMELDAAYVVLRKRHGLKPTLLAGRTIQQCAGISDIQDTRGTGRIHRALSLLKFHALDLIY